MVYLSNELDGKSLSKKISHIWTEWTRKDVPLFDITSKGSFAFKLFLWCLRYDLHYSSFMHFTCLILNLFSLFDIASDIYVFTTFLQVATDIKNVTMENHTSVLNSSARTCTFVEENDDVYKFSCEEYI